MFLVAKKFDLQKVAIPHTFGVFCLDLYRGSFHFPIVWPSESMNEYQWTSISLLFNIHTFAIKDNSGDFLFSYCISVIEISSNLRKFSNRILSEYAIHNKNDTHASYDNDDYMFWYMN